MSDIHEDPLRAFLDFNKEERVRTKPFEGGEHLWVGNAGAELARQRVRAGRFGPFKRSKAPEELTYGEIVAFSGDFYESPSDLFHEKQSALHWFWKPNDLQGIIEVLKRELSWIQKPAGQRGTSYPTNNIALWWNAKQYIELALRNTSHFGWHNALEYVRWHEAALELAARSAREKDPNTQDLLWREAVYTNGFADHFLTDGFAAGHVRTPAAQLRRWAKASGLDDKVAGILIKVIHDQDGHLQEQHGKADHRKDTEGLRVINANSKDVSWRTYCDGQLFLTGTDDNEAARQAVEAVAASVEEFLRASQGEPLPEGVFAATRFIPWPHPEEMPLATKFPAGIDKAAARALLDNIRWYARLPLIGADIGVKDIQACFAVLSERMAEFRDDVKAEVSRSPDLVRRLAPELIAGYESVQ